MFSLLAPASATRAISSASVSMRSTGTRSKLLVSEISLLTSPKIFLAAWLAWLDILAASTAALPIIRSRSLLPDKSDLMLLV